MIVLRDIADHHNRSTSSLQQPNVISIDLKNKIRGSIAVIASAFEKSDTLKKASSTATFNQSFDGTPAANKIVKTKGLRRRKIRSPLGALLQTGSQSKLTKNYYRHASAQSAQKTTMFVPQMKINLQNTFGDRSIQSPDATPINKRIINDRVSTSPAHYSRHRMFNLNRRSPMSSPITSVGNDAAVIMEEELV